MVRTTLEQLLDGQDHGMINPLPIEEALINSGYTVRISPEGINASRTDSVHTYKLCIRATPTNEIFPDSDVFFGRYHIGKEERPKYGGPNVDNELNRIKKSLIEGYKPHSS